MHVPHAKTVAFYLTVSHLLDVRQLLFFGESFFFSVISSCQFKSAQCWCHSVTSRLYLKISFLPHNNSLQTISLFLPCPLKPFCTMIILISQANSEEHLLLEHRRDCPTGEEPGQEKAAHLLDLISLLYALNPGCVCLAIKMSDCL